MIRHSQLHSCGLHWTALLTAAYAPGRVGGSAGGIKRTIIINLPPRLCDDPSAYMHECMHVMCAGAAFLACTPERLYVRSGQRVASEAVAGTRPRGPPGDLEADFYQVRL